MLLATHRHVPKDNNLYQSVGARCAFGAMVITARQPGSKLTCETFLNGGIKKSVSASTILGIMARGVMEYRLDSIVVDRGTNQRSRDGDKRESRDDKQASSEACKFSGYALEAAVIIARQEACKRLYVGSYEARHSCQQNRMHTLYHDKRVPQSIECSYSRPCQYS